MAAKRGVKRKVKEEKENVKKAIKKEPVKIKKEEVSDFSDHEMDEYEQQRLKNIADRKNKFDELKLNEISADVSFEYVKPKKTASRRGLSAPNHNKEKAPLEPMRKSLRLQRIDADTGVTLPDKEPTRYHIVEYDEPQRPPIKDLTLEELCNNNEDWESTSKYFNDKIKPHLDQDNKKSFLSSSCFSDISKIAKGIKSLKITPERVAKVAPDRIFSLAIHPSETKLLVCAGGKWGSIGFWDVKDNKSEKHGVQVIKHHSRPINCLSFDTYDSSKLVSTSYDGSVRLFDINAEKSSVVFAFDEDDSSYTTYHEQINPNCFLITMGRIGQVGLIDTRVSNSKAASSFKLYEKASPKMVSGHPVNKDLFVTPSSKGDCGIYDVRKANGSKLVQPLANLVGHTRAISSAKFSAKTGNKVVTVAYDNKLRIFDTSEGFGSVLKPKMNITHNNQTGRWLTTFKAEWHPRSDEVFFVGSMNQPRQMDIYTTNMDHFVLKGEDLASVTSIVKCHPTQDIVVGGNSSGRIHVFM